MATQGFIDRHHRAGIGNTMGATASLGFFIGVAQRALADGRPGDAGPCHRDANLDDRRRHLAWLQNQAYLAALADYRAPDHLAH